jgi:hypothetical protein
MDGQVAGGYPACRAHLSFPYLTPAAVTLPAHALPPPMPLPGDGSRFDYVGIDDQRGLLEAEQLP